ncbi:BREX system ATP-binding domain-containing protein [Deinococcus sp.]|uniref:ATP-binding protein n=1 Tax=Deinococcus sp. TaxID=47478 RepID=UPI002869C224|nr:AAA family ATPase [Deinococcus sp.]
MAEAVFVGRRREQEWLRGRLAQAIAGSGQIAFVAGEAGSGKTALVHAFVDEAQRQDPDLLIAVGDCNAQGGLGDPYLPFREILGQLLGTGVRAPRGQAAVVPGRLQKLMVRSVQVLVEVGPDLIGTIVPGAALLAKLGKAVAEKSGWMSELERLNQRGREPSGPMEQSRIYEQYASVLGALSTERPLMLVVDDLHWADPSSVGLLFHLSRRIQDSAILILGTYRPDDIAPLKDGERNPLDKVLAEIKRYDGDVTVDLSGTDTERLQFVHQLLDQEPNRLDAAFRQQLFAHTGGHPLFTVEVLRALQERGELIRDGEGRWIVSRLDWQTLPARVEGVIEERIGRLGDEEREILNVASVEGMSFTAEVVSQIAQLPLRPLLRELSAQLERQHRLVREQGELRAGHPRLAGYRFSHALFQKYLYGELGHAERRMLHGEVARVLEAVYGDQAGELSPQLAWHYDEAGEQEHAARQYVIAGEHALRQGAVLEARQFANRALELLPTGTGEESWRALLLQARVLEILGEPGARQVNVQALLDRAQTSGQDEWLAQAYSWRARLLDSQGDYRAVLPVSEQATAAAARAGIVQLEVEALSMKALALCRLGEQDAAQAVIEQGMTLLETHDDDHVRYRVLNAAEIVYVAAGNYGRVLSSNLEALEVARRLGNRYKEAIELSNLGQTYTELGLHDQAQHALQEVGALGKARVGARVSAGALHNLALVTLNLNRPQEAEAQVRESLVMLAELGDVYAQAGAELYLGYVLEHAGRYPEAQASYQGAHAHFQQSGALGIATDAAAGLARCALAAGDLTHAAEHDSAIWAYLEAQQVVGIENPARVYLTCAAVAGALGRPQTVALALERGYRELIDRSFKISDTGIRRSFLENVPDHRDLLRRWQERHTRSTPDTYAER